MASPRMDSYIICATPRTGSTLLCDLLASTRVAGSPDSFFMSHVDPHWAQQWGLPDRGNLGDRDFASAYLAAAMTAGKGGTDIFGLRLMRENLEGLSGLIGDAHPGQPTDKARLEAAFGKTLFIHLTREDKLAQAVSMVKAEQTGLWHIAPDGTEVERLAPPGEPHFDFQRLDRKIDQLQRHDAAWTSWFTAQGIEPLRIGYESLSANPVGIIERICKTLGVTLPDADRLKAGVARLADDLSLDWMRRYQAGMEAVAP